jgi:hypothetical protein
MYGQPAREPVTPGARRRALRRKPVLRYPTRAYQADRASRTRPGDRHPDQQRPAFAGLSCCTLDKRRPYQLRERFAAFGRRDLYDIGLVALFLDAIFLAVRPDGPKEGVLVA